MLNRVYFDRQWQLSRQIVNHQDNSTASLTGQADFSGQGGKLLFTEHGTLEMPHGTFPATCRTLWQFHPTQIDVFFEDGRFFHMFSATQPCARHLCGDDVYDVDYDFTAQGWQSLWRVSGPQKNYEMTSHYTPLA